MASSSPYDAPWQIVELLRGRLRTAKSEVKYLEQVIKELEKYLKEAEREL